VQGKWCNTEAELKVGAYSSAGSAAFLVRRLLKGLATAGAAAFLPRFLGAAAAAAAHAVQAAAAAAAGGHEGGQHKRVCRHAGHRHKLGRWCQEGVQEHVG
jgi:hypothetical protein